MIKISEKTNCCACGACVQRCPKRCISMQEDEEGFLYPHVDLTNCIDCGLCEKVCPVINQAEPKEPLKVYAAKNKDMQKRELSSSGGLFIALAEKVIEKGGVVFGVVFDEKWEAHHVAAATIEELEPMMRSKYMQSRTETTFAETEKYLKEGREVMYTGTPCQIAGLKKYLRKDYGNLLTVDLICHGVPSPSVWRKYLQEEVGKSARSAAAGKNTVLDFSLKAMPVITGVSFREKSRSGYGWQKFGFVVWGKSPFKGDKNSVLSSSMHKKNPYMRAFLGNYSIRPCCYHCKSKAGRSGADITLGDFWGINQTRPHLNDNMGISAMFILTDKGVSAFDAIKEDMLYEEVSFEEATSKNKSYNKSVVEPYLRKYFWQRYYATKNLKQSVEQTYHPSFFRKVYSKIESILSK